MPSASHDADRAELKARVMELIAWAWADPERNELRSLEQATARIAEAMELIAGEREVIEQRARDGDDTELAELRAFEHDVAMMLEGLERRLKQLR